VENFTNPAALPPGKSPGTQRTGDWVGPRANMDVSSLPEL